MANEGSRYQMFESNMDEYLDEEVESIKLTFESIVKGWDSKEVCCVLKSTRPSIDLLSVNTSQPNS